MSDTKSTSISTTGTRSKRYPREVRERAIRMVAEARELHPSSWAAISSVAQKLGMSTETLRSWIRQEEIDRGSRAGLSTAEAQPVKEPRRLSDELRYTT